MSYKGAHDQMMLFMLLSVSLRLRSICSAELTGCGLLLTDRYVGGISLLILLLARIWLNEYIVPSVKQSFKEMLLGVRDTIKTQYLSEHLCGHNTKLSSEEEFFSLFSLSSRHHAACFLPPPDLEGLWESSAVCVCVGAWVFAHTLLNSKQLLLWHTACISVPVCCQGPHALIKSNLIQMLHPPAAPTRHQPIKQAPPRPLPCDFKIG